MKKQKNNYRGALKYGLKHGVGIIEWEDGCKFKGQFVDNRSKGLGAYQDEEGSVFAGLFSIS